MAEFRALIVGWLLLLPCCTGQLQRGEPLFPVDGGGPPARELVAGLSGLVQTVDGREVPAGRRFELLPGCHLVTNPTRFDSEGTVGGRLWTRTFAILMRAGYSYVIRVPEGIWTSMSDPSWTVHLVAEEWAPDGRVTRQFQSGQPCESN